MLKNLTFSASILEGLGPRFGRDFGRFLGPKMHGNRKNTNLAKTLKILIFLWEIDIFKVSSNNFFKKLSKSSQNLHAFWGLDFGMVLGGFWEGFGRPKSSIFQFYSMFFRCHF